jgi:hypothetical protein
MERHDAGLSVTPETLDESGIPTEKVVHVVGSSGIIYESVEVSDPHLGKTHILKPNQGINPVTTE